MSRTLDETELVHDWNEDPPIDHEVELDDETLRDGLQSPSVSDPSIEKKLEILHLMDSLGICSEDLIDDAYIDMLERLDNEAAQHPVN